MHGLRGRYAGLLAIPLGLLLAACATPDDPRDAPLRGPLLTSHGTATGGISEIVTGHVRWRDPCLLLDGYPVVWPEGQRWLGPRKGVRLSSGHVAAVGDVVNGDGGYVSARSAPVLLGARLWTAARRCLGPTREVVVFNPGSDVHVGLGH